MQYLTKQEIMRLLQDVKGATFIGMVTETEPKMRKKGNPYVGRVKKVSHVNGTLNANYGKSVNRQREREGIEEEFQASAPKWGERVDGTCIIRHNGNLYLEVILNHTDAEYVMDGQAIDKSILSEWLQKSSSYAKQGTEKAIRYVRYKLDNIREITINKQTIKLA